MPGRGSGGLKHFVSCAYSSYNFPSMTTAFIGVGSNLGDREKHLQHAKDFLGSVRGIRFLKCSKIRESEPVGGPVTNQSERSGDWGRPNCHSEKKIESLGGPAGQGKYLNAVWLVETELSVKKLLEKLLEIEDQLGRVREEKNGPRTIDLDILFYDREIIDRPDLMIPHPRAHERLFVLEPMAELDPDFQHPVLKKTMKELFTELSAKT